MEKATGILSRNKKTSKKIPMIPTSTGAMTEYLVQGFEDLHQKD
jgi:hypothetical protein